MMFWKKNIQSDELSMFHLAFFFKSINSRTKCLKRVLKYRLVRRGFVILTVLAHFEAFWEEKNYFVAQIQTKKVIQDDTICQMKVTGTAFEFNEPKMLKYR